MTICVTVRVAEGLVLAADSAVSLSAKVTTPTGQQIETIIQNFNFANKVSHFKDYPIGILSWGLAAIESRSIQSLIMEFEYGFPGIARRQRQARADPTRGTYTVREIADGLLDFIKTKYEAAFPAPPPPPAAPPAGGPPAGAPPTPPPIRPNMGMFIGGYSQNEFFSSQYVYEFPNSTDWTEVRPDLAGGRKSFGANWFGLTDALVRLYLGYDEMAINELVNRGADLTIVQDWANDNVGALPLEFNGMPLQDAIDFAEYSVNVVIGRFRFAQGPPLCGGDVDIAVITPNAFRWAQRKAWGMHHE